MAKKITSKTEKEPIKEPIKKPIKEPIKELKEITLLVKSGKIAGAERKFSKEINGDEWMEAVKSFKKKFDCIEI